MKNELIKTDVVNKIELEKKNDLKQFSDMTKFAFKEGKRK